MITPHDVSQLAYRRATQRFLPHGDRALNNDFGARLRVDGAHLYSVSDAGELEQHFVQHGFGLQGPLPPRQAAYRQLRRLTAQRLGYR